MTLKQVVEVEVWQKKEDGSFDTKTIELPLEYFQGAYFYFNPTGQPSLVLQDGRIVVIKSDVCDKDNILFYDEDARNES